MIVKIIDIIGSSVAISPNKATFLYEHLKKVVQSNEKVVYSFVNVQDCSSAFCNASIGKLYMNLEPKKIASLITFSDFGDNEIWNEKVNRAINLGTEENYRNSSQQTLEEVIA